MYGFINDYCIVAHPNIMKRLSQINLDQHVGYGEDEICQHAKELIKAEIGNPNAAIYFVVGGTQANMSVISSLLKSPEAAICADSGHIYTHETGAIEATGHRVITAETENGKIKPESIEKVLVQYAMRPHVCKPKLVYVSDSTEIGTIYSKAELKALHDCCKKHNLYFYLDGARLASALTAEGNDLTIKDLTELTDVFYIGGTKNGALMGEAVVFNDPKIGEDYDMVMKQRGALLAKGWILGVQFEELFTDGLYFKLARKANQMAAKLTKGFEDNGFKMLTHSTTNQIFPIMKKKQIEALSKHFGFEIWEEIDDETSAIRLVTTWVTPKEEVEKLIAMLKEL